MPDWVIVVGISAVYLSICVGLGLWPGRKTKTTSESYIAGDRSLGLLLMYFITGATIFSAFAFLGAPGWTYSRGAAAFYILGYGAVGMLPLYFIGPRAAVLGRERGYLTQAEMLSDIFDSRAIAVFLALISLVAFVPYLALQMQGAGYVLETVTQGRLPAWFGGLAVYAVVAFYVWKSGVLGVGWTNTFQGIFMMVLAWGLGLYLPYLLYGGIGPLFERIATERPELLLAPGLAGNGQPWAWSEYSSAVLVSIVGFSMWPHLFMKMFTAKDTQTIRRTIVLYPTFQLFLLPLLIIGFWCVFFSPTPGRPDQILPHILMHADISPWVVGLFCAGALAASMSSGDAMAHAASSIAVRDGVKLGLRKPLSSEQERNWTRWGVLLVIAAAYAVAVGYTGSLVVLLLTTYGSVVQFAPVVVAALYIPRVGRPAALAGLSAGCLVTLLFVAAPDARPFTVHAGLYGLIANLTAMTVTTLFTPGRPA